MRGLDSNQRPSGYEPDELPTAPPRGANIRQSDSRKQDNSTIFTSFSQASVYQGMKVNSQENKLSYLGEIIIFRGIFIVSLQPKWKKKNTNQDL